MKVWVRDAGLHRRRLRHGAADPPHRPPEELYTVTVTAGDRTESYTCTVADRCPLPFFLDFTPEDVTVVYQSDSVRVERTFAPEYQRLRPNGADCSPDCLTATVEFRVT